MFHAGRRREPGTTAGVIGPAAVAVGQSDGRWDELMPEVQYGGKIGSEQFVACRTAVLEI